MSTLVAVEPPASTTPTLRRRAPRALAVPGPLRWPLFLGPLALGVISARSSHHLQSDSYFDLYAGRYVAHHGIPRHEVFVTAAHGHAWLDQQWLAHLLYYLAWSVGGYPGFVFLSAVAIAAAFSLHLHTLVRLNVPTQQAFIWSLFALIASISETGARAQSLAYPAFVAVLATVFTDASSARWRPRLLLLPIVVAGWANVHGSVLLGVAIIASYALYRSLMAGRQRDRRSVIGYASVAALSVAALLATPYGWRSVSYYGNVLGNRTLTTQVMEWRAPAWGDGVSEFYFLAVLVVFLTLLLVLVRRRTSPAMIPTLVTAALFLMSTRAVRHEVWFVLSGTMLAAATKARATRRPSARMTAPVLAGAGLLALAGAVVTALTPASTFESGVSRPVLAAADRAALADPRHTVVANQLNATALLWLHPDSAGHVAFDIRFEQYDVNRLSAYMDFTRVVPGWTSFARRYGVVVLPLPAERAAVSQLARDSSWRLLARTPDGAAFETRAP